MYRSQLFSHNTPTHARGAEAGARDADTLDATELERHFYVQRSDGGQRAPKGEARRVDHVGEDSCVGGEAGAFAGPGLPQPGAVTAVPARELARCVPPGRDNIPPTIPATEP